MLKDQARRASASGVPIVPRTAGELAAFGERALDSMGSRLAVLFSVTVAVAIPLAPGSNRHLVAMAALEGASAVSVAALIYVIVRRPATVWLVTTLVGAGVVGGLLASSPALDTRSSQQLLAWALSGIAGSVAMSRGPTWGLTAFLVTMTAFVGVEQLGSSPFPLNAFLGSLAYYVGGALTHIFARRGFATTERELAASEAAQAAQEIAEERWRARLQVDRQLHDTVLATLTLLAHRGVGLSDDQIRAACERDIVTLKTGVSALAVESSTAIGDPATSVDAALSVDAMLRLVTARAVALGIDLRVHAASAVLDHAAIRPRVGAAVGEALSECVTNVRTHTDVSVADVMVTASDGALVLVVLDEGQGFDLTAVPEDRLGLRASVRDRIAEVGGSTTIWSMPGQGTSVMLRVPLLQPGVVDPASRSAAGSDEEA